jgi:hypothetical protein
MIERRAVPRFPLHPPAGCPLYTAAGRLLGVAIVEDVSVKGIRLLVSHPLPAGETLVVEVGRPPCLPMCRLEMVVDWCQAAPAGGFLLGGRLLNPLAEDKARALAGSLAEP